MARGKSALGKGGKHCQALSCVRPACIGFMDPEVAGRGVRLLREFTALSRSFVCSAGVGAMRKVGHAGKEGRRGRLGKGSLPRCQALSCVRSACIGVKDPEVAWRGVRLLQRVQRCAALSGCVAFQCSGTCWGHAAVIASGTVSDADYIRGCTKWLLEPVAGRLRFQFASAVGLCPPAALAQHVLGHALALTPAPNSPSPLCCIGVPVPMPPLVSPYPFTSPRELPPRSPLRTPSGATTTT